MEVIKALRNRYGRLVPYTANNFDMLVSLVDSNDIDFRDYVWLRSNIERMLAVKEISERQQQK